MNTVTHGRVLVHCPICDCADFSVLYAPWVQEDDPQKNIWGRIWNPRHSVDDSAELGAVVAVF